MKEDNESHYYSLKDIYTDTKELMFFQGKSVSEIKSRSLFVLDTNILLLPYEFGSQDLASLSEIYKKMILEGRLIIPDHVIREFLHNRPNKLIQIYNKIYGREYNPNPINITKSTLLESLNEYKEMIKIEKEMNSKIIELRELSKKQSDYINKILNIIKDWNWNDPVSKVYINIFSKEIIYEYKFDPEKMLLEAKERYEYKIPPGYKDYKKDSINDLKADLSEMNDHKKLNRTGDLIIWHSIIDLAKSKKKDIVFVSNDQKSDWWYQSQKNQIYPRFELIAEFFEKTGQYISIIGFKEFLEINKARKTLISTVEQLGKYQIDQLAGELNSNYPDVVEGIIDKIDSQCLNNWTKTLTKISSGAHTQEATKLIIKENEEILTSLIEFIRDQAKTLQKVDNHSLIDSLFRGYFTNEQVLVICSIRIAQLIEPEINRANISHKKMRNLLDDERSFRVLLSK